MTDVVLHAFHHSHVYEKERETNAPLWWKCTALVLFNQLYFDFCFRRAAQNAFIRADCSSRAAALMGARFRRFAATLTAAGAAAGAGACACFGALDPGGRPRRFAEPCNASIARLNRSRSATKSATICSVCIIVILTLRTSDGKR